MWNFKWDFLFLNWIFRDKKREGEGMSLVIDFIDEINEVSEE